MKNRHLGILFLASIGLCRARAANGAAPAAGGNITPDGNGDASGTPSKKYAALGSSYAAGPKIPNAVPDQSCGRSTGNYAHLVAADLGLDLTEASCIGATIDNVATTPQAMNPLQIGPRTG